MIWIARAVCIPQVGTIFQQILGVFFALVSSANFLHVHSTKHVWCVTPCTVSTRQLYISCGHGVHVPWPHSNRSYCLGTISAYRRHTVTVHTVWVRYLCGYGSVYHSHAATVHTVWAWCPYTVATWRQCHAVATQQLCGQR